jgi:type II secretory pathway pseudopilin PulG
MKKTLHKRGLSLVEAIVVIAMFSVLMFAITSAVTTFYRSNSYTVEQAYEVNNARRGLELLIRDMREMTFADNGTFPLVTMDDNDITFYSDVDRDDSVELVSYQLSSTTLYKYVYNATGSPPTYSTTTPDETYIVSEYVRNIDQGTSTFRYFDESVSPATATTTITDVRYIEANIIVNIDPNRNPGEFTLRSSTALRNLKSNF